MSGVRRMWGRISRSSARSLSCLIAVFSFDTGKSVVLLVETALRQIVLQHQFRYWRSWLLLCPVLLGVREIECWPSTRIASLPICVRLPSLAKQVSASIVPPLAMPIFQPASGS